MLFLLHPWHILLAALWGMANTRQQQNIEFQNTQITPLLKELECKRLLLDDQQRRSLTVTGSTQYKQFGTWSAFTSNNTTRVRRTRRSRARRPTKCTSRLVTIFPRSCKLLAGRLDNHDFKPTEPPAAESVNRWCRSRVERHQHERDVPVRL